MSSPTFNRDTTGEEVVSTFESSITNKTVVLTGPTPGSIGAETVIALALAKPALVVLIGRSAPKARPVIDAVKDKSSGKTRVHFVEAELDHLASVRKAADKVNDLVNQIDILFNIAGVMAVPKYTLSKDGFESQFAINHLSHFLLTNLLANKLIKGKARILNMTSDGYEICPLLTDVNFNNGTEYDPWSGYGQSKTANILFSLGLRSYLGKHGVTSMASHPGVGLMTGIGRAVRGEGTKGNDMWAWLQPAVTKHRGPGIDFTVGKPKELVRLIATGLRGGLDGSLEGDAGVYMVDCQVAEPAGYATDPREVERLWKISEEMVGEKFEYSF